MFKSAIALFLVFITLTVAAQEKIQGWYIFNTDNSGLPNNHVRDIQMNKEGVFWIGTWGGGITKLDQEEKTWQTFNPSNSDLPSNIINNIAIGEQKIWATCHDKGIAYFNGESWFPVSFPPNVITQSIVVNEAGVVLIGTQAHGLFQYTIDGVLSRVWGEDNNVNYGVTDIDLDSKEFALVSTRQGLFSFFKDPTGVYAAVKTELKTESTYKTLIDEVGRIWAIDGEKFHVSVREGNRWRKFRETSSAIYTSPNGGVKTYQASIIAPISDERIAIGTQYYGGIALYQKKSWGPLFTPYSSDDLDGGIQVLIEDKDGALWAGTTNYGLMVQVGEDHTNPKLKKEEEKELTEEEKEALRKKRKEQEEMITKRRIEIKDTIHCKNRRIEILIWDDQKIDGDRVSLALNGEFILENYTLEKRAKRIWVDLNPKKNKLVLYAHNLGKTPPNTASLSILDVNFQKEISLSSTMVGSQALIIIPDLKE